MKVQLVRSGLMRFDGGIMRAPRILNRPCKAQAADMRDARQADDAMLVASRPIAHLRHQRPEGARCRG